MNSTHITGLLLAYSVFLLAMASPGPDFFITLRNALRFGTKAGILTAIGIGAGLIFHMSYCVAGIGILITKSILLFDAIKWIGAAYLFYVGIQAVRSKGTTDENTAEQGAPVTLSPLKAFTAGFVTNLFNPKATMFFLALFTQVIDPHTPFSVLALFGGSCVMTAVLWFSGVSVVMTVPPLRRAYIRASKWIDRVAGVFFIGLGAKLAATRL